MRRATTPKRASNHEAAACLALSHLMTPLERLIATHGGAIATYELHANGLNRVAITNAVRTGILWRARQGWYVIAGTDATLVKAARVGGRVTCSTALSFAGVWVVPDQRLHVRVDQNDCRLRSVKSSRVRLADSPQDQVVVHWQGVLSTQSRLLCDVADALDDYRRCAPHDWYLAALESSIRQHPVIVRDLRARGHRAVGETVDGQCESGIETMCWVRLLRGLGAKRQVSIAGVGRVDFLLGSRLVIEVDGAAFHDRGSQFENDRRRDAELSARGYRVLRFSYRQIVHDWPLVEAAIWAALARRDNH
jgi:very-short-patch-repair endonuclease